MTRACVLLSILLANSRAWPHRPPFIAASNASYYTDKEELISDFYNTLAKLLKHSNRGVCLYLLAAKQQQLPEAFCFLANVLRDGHEGVR